MHVIVFTSAGNSPSTHRTNPCSTPFRDPDAPIRVPLGTIRSRLGASGEREALIPCLTA